MAGTAVEAEKTMSEPLSFYMLVKNSERYLDIILSRIAPIADEIILLDSGSEDRTQAIADKWQARWHTRSLDNFRNQRAHALALCQHRYVFFLDSDEIPDPALINHIQSLKNNGFNADAYLLPREWIVLGKPVHSIYPICSPDYPVRLVDKAKVSFSGSTQVHESYSGYQTTAVLSGKVQHYTFHSRNELKQKLHFYARIAAEDLLERGKKSSVYKRVMNPPFAWCKWYFFKQGWRDGQLGLILANYAFRYTFLKYNYISKQQNR